MKSNIAEKKMLVQKVFNKVFDKLSYKPRFVINNLNELLEIV